jgi:hypothetical protein
MPSCLRALIARHLCGARFAALQAAFASERDRRRVLPGVLGRVLELASGDVHHELGKPVWVHGALA